MTADVRWIFVPGMPWNGVTACGAWLECFLSMLATCPSKDPNFNESEDNAFGALYLASRSFVHDLVRLPVTSKIPLQICYISASSKAQGLDPNKSYEEARSYLIANKDMLSPKGADAILSEQLYCLDLLHALRDSVKHVISFIDISRPFTYKDYFDKTYRINPKKMYQEFLTHYSYDTMMHYPQPIMDYRMSVCN